MARSIFGKSRSSMEGNAAEDAKSVKSNNPLSRLKSVGDHLRPHTAVTSTNRAPGKSEQDVAAGTSAPLAGRANANAANAGAADSNGTASNSGHQRNASQFSRKTNDTREKSSYDPSAGHKGTSEAISKDHPASGGNADSGAAAGAGSVAVPGAAPSSGAPGVQENHRASISTAYTSATGGSAASSSYYESVGEGLTGAGAGGAAGAAAGTARSNSKGHAYADSQSTALGHRGQNGNTSQNAEPSWEQRQQQQDQSSRTEKVMNGLNKDEKAPNVDGTTGAAGKKGGEVASADGASSRFDFGDNEGGHENAPMSQLTQEQRTRQEHIARQMGVPPPPVSQQTSAPSPRIGTQYQRQFEAHDAIPTNTPGAGPAVYNASQRRPSTAHNERLATAPQPTKGQVPDEYKFKDSDVRMPRDVPGLGIGDDDPMAKHKQKADGTTPQAALPSQVSGEGEKRRPRPEDRSDVSKNLSKDKVLEKRGTKEDKLVHTRSRYAEYAGWRQVGGWNSGEHEDQGDQLEDNLLSRATILDDYISNKYIGDWYQNTALIIMTAFFSWVCGRFNGSISWLSIILLFSATTYRTSIRRVKRNARDDVIREMSLETLTEDKESMEWLNSFLIKFWLIYEPSLSQMITEIANEILEGQTPPMVQSLTLEKFTLGTKAPRLEFVRTFPRTDATVAVMDFSASFTPNDVMDLTSRQLKRKVNPKVQLGIRIGKGFVSKSLPVLVEDMSFTGIMRFRIKMMPRFPHIQTVDVSFITPPNFDFVLKPVGGDTFGFDINVIPGLSKFIKDIVHANLGPMFYAPNAFQVNVEQMMAGVGIMSGVGVLTINVQRASKLRADTRDGSCDPYVRVLNHQKTELASTKIKADTKEPVWKESLNVIVTNLSETVVLEVMDFKDKHNDRAVGNLSFPLEKVLDEQGDDLITSEILSGGRPTGELTYSLHYSAVQMPDPNSQDKGASIRDTKSGILALTVHGARNLDPSASTIRELSSYCEIELNGEPAETTKVVKANNDPDYGFSKELIIPNKTGMFVVFRVRHHKGKKSNPQVGLLKLRLQELILQNEKGRDWFPLENEAGDLHISTQWKPCAIAGVAGSSYVEPIGMLRLFIKSANDLRNLEHVGKVDPYVRVFLAGRQVGRTEYFKGTLDPVYDESIYAPVQNEMQTLTFECMDAESHGHDRSLGTFEVDLEDYIQKNDQGDYKVFASDKIFTQRLVMPDRGPKGTVSFAVEFYPAFHIVAPSQLNKLNQAKKEIQEIRAKEKPEEEDAEKLQVLNERVQISGIDMPLEKQLTYSAGVLAVTVDTIEGLQRGECIRITRDNNPMPIFTSKPSRGKRLVVGDSFDYLTGQLDLSSFRIEVIEGGGEGVELDEVADHIPARADTVIGARELLDKAYFDPFKFEFPLDPEINITLSGRYFPTPDFKISPEEDLANGGILEVSVLRANEVEAADSSGTSDPYVAFYLNHEKDKVYKSRTIKKTLNPVWNEKFQLKINDFKNLTLKAVVSDWDMGNRDDPLGGAAFECNELAPLEFRMYKEPLSDKIRKGKDRARGKDREGTLEIGLRFIPGVPPEEKELGIGGALGSSAHKHGKLVAGTLIGAGAGGVTKGHKTITGLLGRKSQSESDDNHPKTTYSVTIDKVFGLGSVKEIQVRAFSLDQNERELYRSKNVKCESGEASLDDAEFDFETNPHDQLGIKVSAAKVIGHKDIGQGACDLKNGQQDVDLGECSVRVTINRL